MVRYALFSPPNCGKTTLFNRLTGSHGDVGNRMGVTVAPRQSRFHFPHGQAALLTDLPGLYSPEGFTPEEILTRKFLTQTPPDQMVCLIDATAPEQGLALAIRLSRFHLPMILAVNFCDVLSARGGTVNEDLLSRRLGIPVVSISAATGKGINRLLTLLESRQAHTMTPLSEDAYSEAERLTDEAFVFGPDGKRCRMTGVDRLLRTVPLSLGLFFLFLVGIFYLAFGAPGTFLADKVNQGWDLILTGAAYIGSLLRLPPLVMTLFIDGVGTGIGVLLGFLPQLFLLFFFLSQLEESGILARTAFLSDGFFRRFHLSGHAAIPLLLGLGCTVPAVLSTRTVPRRGERIRLIQSLPFIPCGARLPVCGMLCKVLFPGYEAVAMLCLYLAGFVAALLRARFGPQSAETAVYFLELPPLRMPRPTVVLRTVLFRLGEYTRRTFGLLALAYLLFRLLGLFTFSLRPADSVEQSILGQIAGWFLPLFRPCGLGDIRLIFALFSGLLAKEATAGTLAIFAPGEVATLFSAPAQIMAFLTLYMLYCPCISALAAIRQELGRRAMLKSVFLQLVLAWLSAVAVFQLLSVLK